MPQSLSKFVLALEALLIATPLTVLYIWVLFPAAFLSALFLRSSVASVLVNIVTLLSLLAGWMLMVRFWRYGAAGLRTSPSAVWGAAYAGAAAAMIGTLLLFAGESMGWRSQSTSEAFTLIYGIPLLVPFGHLLAERFFRSAANTSLERTRDE